MTLSADPLPTVNEVRYAAFKVGCLPCHSVGQAGQILRGFRGGFQSQAQALPRLKRRPPSAVFPSV
jgi:hypothetical protein